MCGSWTLYLFEARPSKVSLRWEVCSAKDWVKVWREPERKGPASPACGGLDEGHVDLVHVRPLLPVHLHVDEPSHREKIRIFLGEILPILGRF